MRLLPANRRFRPARPARALGCETRGSITVVAALSMPVLVVLVGMGLDYYVALSDKARLDAAADAAALAAVNAAKAYFAANSGAQSPAALQSNAVAAGLAQAPKAFAINVNSTELVSAVTPSVTLTYSNLTFSASVTYSARVPAHFGPLVGISALGIAGQSAAASNLPKYLDFYVVVDTSASMGIPIDASDQQLLMETNPDNSSAIGSYYPHGCQFACHFYSYSGFNYAEANNIPLKLNSVGSAVQALLASAASSEAIVDQYRIGIYPFIDDLIAAAPLSGNFTTANSVAGNLANYLDQGSANGGMGSGGTHYENLWSDLSPFLQTPGTGYSSTSTFPFIVLVTDGVDNNQVFNPTTWAFSGSQPELPTESFCNSAKAAGYTLAVILIPYTPIVDPDPGFANNEDGIVNGFIANNQINPVMQNCASNGYFFQATTAAEINTAMQTLLYQAVEATRLTQ